MHKAIHSLKKNHQQDAKNSTREKRRKTVSLYVGLVLTVLFILFNFSDANNLLKNYWILDSSYSHGPLILCISIYLLFWHQRVELLNAEIQPTFIFLPLLFASLFFWWSAKVLNIQVLQVAALPLILLFTFYCLWGKFISRIAFFPIMLFYLAIPIWTIILNPLQDITIWINSRLIETTRIPAFIEGTNVHIPAGTFSIEQGCAGLKYLLSALSTVILMAYLSSASTLAKCLAISLAIITTLIANWIRVFLIIIIGHISNMQNEIVNDHSNFGWFIFAIFFLPLLLTCHKLLPVNIKDTEEYKPFKHSKKKRAYQLIIALFIIIIFLLSSKIFSPSNINTLNSMDNLVLPIINNDWNGPTKNNTKVDLPKFNGFSHNVSGNYKKIDLTATVSVIKYQKQQQGSELIHYENHLFDTKQWQQAEHRRLWIAIGSDKKQTVMEKQLLSVLGNKRLIYYWYKIGAYSTTSKVFAKLLQIPALMHHRADASLYFVSIDCRNNCENEKEEIQPILLKILKSAKP